MAPLAEETREEGRVKDTLKHEVAVIKAGQACALLEEALEDAPRNVIARLQNILRKHSYEIVTKGIG